MPGVTQELQPAPQDRVVGGLASEQVIAWIWVVLSAVIVRSICAGSRPVNTVTNSASRASATWPRNSPREFWNDAMGFQAGGIGG